MEYLLLVLATEPQWSITGSGNNSKRRLIKNVSNIMDLGFIHFILYEMEKKSKPSPLGAFPAAHGHYSRCCMRQEKPWTGVSQDQQNQLNPAKNLNPRSDQVVAYLSGDKRILETKYTPQISRYLCTKIS